MMRVEWKSKITGATGRGVWLPASLAQAWAQHGNQFFPELEHWTVKK
jgi:hypothetical protein